MWLLLGLRRQTGSLNNSMFCDVGLRTQTPEVFTHLRKNGCSHSHVMQSFSVKSSWDVDIVNVCNLTRIKVSDVFLTEIALRQCYTVFSHYYIFIPLCCLLLPKHKNSDWTKCVSFKQCQSMKKYLTTKQISFFSPSTVSI